MARISVDDGLGRDSRLDILAELCGWTRRETVGCLQLDVWPLCYDRVTPNIPARDLNAAANRGAVTPVAHAQGFSGALIESGLGRLSTKRDTAFVWVRKGKPNSILNWKDREWRDRVYVCGAAERIAYLIKSEESGRIGGYNSGESRQNKTKGPLRHPQGTVEGLGEFFNPTPTPTPTPTASATDRSEKNSATPSAGGSLELFDSKPEGKRSRKTRTSGASESERRSALVVLAKVGARNGVRYTGTDEHVRLIANQLRNGISVDDMRKVIGYCAIQLKWAEKPELVEYLRPETLFGPKTISKYLDPARSWFQTQGLELEPIESTTAEVA